MLGLWPRRRGAPATRTATSAPSRPAGFIWGGAGAILVFFTLAVMFDETESPLAHLPRAVRGGIALAALVGGSLLFVAGAFSAHLSPTSQPETEKRGNLVGLVGLGLAALPVAAAAVITSGLGGPAPVFAVRLLGAAILIGPYLLGARRILGAWLLDRRAGAEDDAAPVG